MSEKRRRKATTITLHATRDSDEGAEQADPERSIWQKAKACDGCASPGAENDLQRVWS